MIILILIGVAISAVTRAYQNPATPYAPVITQTTSQCVKPQPQPTQAATILKSMPSSKPLQTTKITISKKGEEDALEKLINSHPELGKKIKSMFEYHGIAAPWNAIHDMLTTDQQPLPDPCMLFVNIKNMLKLFETMRELISDEFEKVKVFVRRDKAYLKEDQEKIKGEIQRMENYMQKIKAAKNETVKREYAKKFTDMHGRAEKDVQEYQRLKMWLAKVLCLFQNIF